MYRVLTALLLPLITVVCLMLAAPQAQAQTTIVVTPTPAKFQVSVNAPTTVSVVWRIVRNSPPIPGTSSSSNAQILVGGTPVATIGGPLSRSFPGATFVETAFLSETVTIPQAAVFRAVKSGAPITLSRTFNDTSGTSDTGVATLAPTGPGAEPFSVSRLELRFDDDSRFKVLPKSGRLRAVAELNTTGNGLIIGQWEIAPAATTAGTPVFRPFALVRHPVAGGRRVVITSPPLPTRFEGNNIVRLRLTDPDTFFDEPELQYYVTPESPLPEKQEPRLMLVTAPSPGTPLTLTTRFAWQAVPGATLYKLEIFGAPAGPAGIVAEAETTTPVPLNPAPDTASVQGLRALTGVVVPGTVTEVRLRDYSLAHLPADRRYLWTVKAQDDQGAVIAVSPVREIYKP
mgnify:CR=1 FL=1